ncbi:hypothetical protein ON010_g7758 [Phytophthora cinnamomi]|nr:hypothetical protein ON010_g7758 [Phytophthora cinnamomi]
MVAVRGKFVGTDNVPFGLAWRELKKQGWTSVRSRAKDLDPKWKYVRPGADPNGVKGVDFFHGEEELLEYYTAGDRRKLRRMCYVPCPPPESFADAHGASRTPAASNFTSEPAQPPPVSTTATPAQAEAVTQAPATVPPLRRQHHHWLRDERPRRKLRHRATPMPGRRSESDQRLNRSTGLPPPSDVPRAKASSEEDSSTHASDSEEVKVPAPALHPSTHPHDNVCGFRRASRTPRWRRCCRFGDKNASAVESAEVGDVPDPLADTTDILNVDAAGGRDVDYNALKSGDEAAQDDVVTDAECDRDEWPSDASAMGESEANPEQDAMDIQLAKEFLDEFAGADAILAGNLMEKPLKEFSATGWGVIHEPNVYNELKTRTDTRGAASWRLADGSVLLFHAGCAVATHSHMLEQVPAGNADREKTRRDVHQELQSVAPNQPHELCRFLGLLITRTICPNREKLASHWKTTDEGAILRGAFNAVMARDRFFDICRNLHFNDNDDPRALTDRAWKIRKVVEVLQRSLREGYVPPAELSFDEAMLPSRSSFNKMRVYMKAKPHKWGTKLFEVYCGKKKHASDKAKHDKKEGPAAVIRNLRAVFGDTPSTQCAWS